VLKIDRTKRAITGVNLFAFTFNGSISFLLKLAGYCSYVRSLVVATRGRTQRLPERHLDIHTFIESLSLTECNLSVRIDLTFIKKQEDELAKLDTAFARQSPRQKKGVLS